jgi:hypothetical protein
LPAGSQPQSLTQADLDAAVRTVVFSDLPADYKPPRNVALWTVSPVSENYAAARDTILQKLEILLADLGGARVD